MPVSRVNKRVNGSYEATRKKATFSLSLFSYEDGGLCVIYSPAFDIFGYGKTEKDAEKSFEITFEEFLRYTSNKNTFFLELKRLGWTITGTSKNPKLNPPNLETLLKSNEQFNELFNEKPYRKYIEAVQLPAYS